MVEVIKGKNNFLFLKNDTNDVISQIIGKKPIPSYMFCEIDKEIEKRIIHSKKNNYIYIYIIPPNKECIYHEYHDYNISNNRPSIQLSSRYPDVFIYPYDQLINIKNKYLLYYKTDTHWTTFSILHTFNHLDKILKTDIIVNLDQDTVTKNIIGDHGSKIDPNSSESFTDLKLELDIDDIFINKINNIGGYIYIRTKNIYKKRCLIFGDSFIRNHIKKLSLYFYEIYFFHAPVFDIDIINNIKPDIVISENVERFINGKFYRERFIYFLIKKIFSLNKNDIDKINIDRCAISENYKSLFYKYKNLFLSNSPNMNDFIKFYNKELQ